MQKNTLILIVGTNGSGKSTLMRAVLQGLGGPNKSANRYITTVNGSKEVCIIGPYGKSKCNVGGDFFCATKGRDIIATIKEAKNTYKVVLCEGRYIATASNKRLDGYFSDGSKVIGIYLSADEDFVKTNILKRGGKYNPSMMNTDRNIRNWIKKMRTIGAITAELPPSLDFNQKSNFILDIIKNELK